MSQSEIEAQRVRKQNATLTKHYRAIGPAAIVAALLHAKKSVPHKKKAA